MENFGGKKRPTINLNLFTTFSESISPTKSPRNFQDGVVGLGIVAAMTDETYTRQPICFAPSPRSATPVPIVPSVGPAPNSRCCFNSENSDELSQNPTCVISHAGDNSNSCRAFTASSSVIGQFKREFWSDDFLTYCHLCKKELHGLDIFMYRGEKAFCSDECRDKQITNDDNHKQTCKAEARKKPLSESAPHCSGPQVLFTVVAAA
ncbi:Detected protein of unknown function [Hibiscus syriacus]|uniref:FLZ-type domain-containing protein n=1 Tax=Hibiscus syriacus TaxID=106335 RepID=A0A6A2WQU7_HIBSY|nr:FCS-Like Zinc finger 14-like [Hibiscus syriacus]KAE8657975.1 Detected protein of unknown function [Hibiscus syriacus]